VAEQVKPIIIIKKKKVHHGGHHGGAWKVAYADFVTAMMALFIVLWLVSSSEQVKKAVGGYFQDPSGTGKLAGSTMGGMGDALAVSKEDMKDLKARLEEALKQMPKFTEMKGQIELAITPEGLRIELLETEKGMFFESGSGVPTENGRVLLAKLASELAKIKNTLLIEGHTDARPFAGQSSYTNWELSTDRANAARRIIEEGGVGADQIVQVRGFANRRLRKPADATDPSNRRVTLIVQPMAIPAPPQSVEKPAGAHKAPEAHQASAAPKPAAH